jgi:hypothetical protein
MGYHQLSVRATITDSTGGSVAFSDSANERIMCGYVTATGMNGAGYNPTGTPTTRSIQCLKVGGAAPGFPAEAGCPIPMGARLRFDAATTTVALRNICRVVNKISGGDTLEVDALLPATPAAGDVFYLEMPGAKFAVINVGAFACNNNVPPNLAGLYSTGAILSTSRGSRFAGVWTDSSFIAIDHTSLSVSRSYQIPNGTGNAVVQSGGGIRCQTLSCTRGTITVQGCIVSTAQQGINQGIASWGYGSVSGGQMSVSCPTTQVARKTDTFSPIIGTDAVDASAFGIGRTRVIGTTGTIAAGGALVCAAGTQLQSIEIINAGAKACITVDASGVALYLADLVGSTGNTDVGFDATFAYGCTFIVSALSTPTLTGTAGDVRDGGGTIRTWADCLAGLTDAHGNQFISE